MNRKIDLLNPFFIYSFTWLFVLFLVAFQATTNLLPLNLKTVVLVLSNIFTFAIIFFTMQSMPPNIKPSNQISSLFLLEKLRKFIRILLGIWLIGTVFEILIGGGVPLLWIFTKPELKYTHFGIHSFHGFMNALYLFSVTGLFLEYLINRKKRFLFSVGVLLLWPVIMVERGILLGALLQMLAIYFLFIELNIKRVFKLLSLLLLVVVIFGFIGDIRFLADAHVIANPYAKYIGKNYETLFHYLPSGFTWFYIYITSPINNIISSINDLHPSYIPYYSIFYTIPTAIRALIFSHVDINPIKLLDDNFNVSTFYVGFLADFGITGAIIIVALLQVFFTWLYFVAKQKQVWAMLAYAVVFECIVFSIFFNLLFLSVYLMQIFLAIGFKWYVNRIKGEQKLKLYEPVKNI